MRVHPLLSVRVCVHCESLIWDILLKCLVSDRFFDYRQGCFNSIFMLLEFLLSGQGCSVISLR